MTPLRRQMLAALHLRGTGERTQQSSVREGRLLSECYHTSPKLLAEAERQQYFLHRKHVAHLAPNSMRICSRGIRLLSPHVLQRAGHILSRIRAETAHRLPTVLRPQESGRLLKAATPWHNQVDCTTRSSLGRRLQAGRCLQVFDSDAQRMMGHGHRGKGAQDRDVPLPQDTLRLLRRSWATPRHPTWLFPATGRDHQHSPPATFPRRRARVQGACRKATQRAGVPKLGGALPPLRHAYAPPLLEAGVNLRRIPLSLGPTRLDTTMLYRHLPPKGPAEASQRIHSLMRGLTS